MAGVYSVISFLVNQRTGEMGLRMALGARPGQIAALVFRDAGGLLLAGLVIGAAGAASASSLIRSFLYEVKPADALTYTAVALASSLAVAMAVAGPAWRAARVNPSETLHEQ